MFTKQKIMDEWQQRHNPAEEAGLNLALVIAASALFEQKQRNGSDYMEHPLIVAFNNTQSTDKQIVGVLHDVVEDSDWTLDDLRTIGFSERIVAGVEGVTKRDGEKYFDFIVRCGQAGIDAIDIKLSDLEHNNLKIRSKSISAEEKHIWKEKAYNISYFYLVAIKKDEIEPGTPIYDYIKTQPDYTQHPEVVNTLMNTFSSETERLESTDQHATPA